MASMTFVASSPVTSKISVVPLAAPNERRSSTLRQSATVLPLRKRTSDTKSLHRRAIIVLTLAWIPLRFGTMSSFVNVVFFCSISQVCCHVASRVAPKFPNVGLGKPRGGGHPAQVAHVIRGGLPPAPDSGSYFPNMLLSASSSKERISSFVFDCFKKRQNVSSFNCRVICSNARR